MKVLSLLIAPLLTLSALFVLFIATPQTVSAHHCFGHADGSEAPSGNIAECLDAGACLDTEAPECENQDKSGERVDNLVKTVVNVISWVVGIVSVIMIIIGGLKYITSSGDSANVTSAKNTILYAIIGLVVVAFAQIIVRFVLDTATGEEEAYRGVQVAQIERKEQ